MKSWSRPESSTMVTPPILAPVRERAPSRTPCNTASRSRSSVMCRLASLSLESRSLSAAISRIGSSGRFISSPRLGAEAATPALAERLNSGQPGQLCHSPRKVTRSHRKQPKSHGYITRGLYNWGCICPLMGDIHLAFDRLSRGGVMLGHWGGAKVYHLRLLTFSRNVLANCPA